MADRPKFKRMCEDASRRKFDLCFFWALDRLSRETRSEDIDREKIGERTNAGLRRAKRDGKRLGLRALR